MKQGLISTNTFHKKNSALGWHVINCPDVVMLLIKAGAEVNDDY